MTTLDAHTTTGAAVVRRLRTTYDAGRTRPLDWRREQLLALGRLLREREDELVAALAADLGRHPFEAWLADLRATGREVEELEHSLEKWLAPQRVRVPAIMQPGRARVVREPRGVVLVIGPWNYPVQLLLVPLAAALAAGNAVVLKPSEVSPTVSTVLSRLVPEYLDPDAVAVVEGGPEETTDLLEQRFDHVFYTGNGAVGRIVAEAAARHLTPVTLELGGKSPVIVTADADVELAASRVAFSRFLNAGQTCVASDHVWVHRDVEAAFLDALRVQLRKRYGADPRQSTDYGRMVNARHAARVQGLLDAGGFEVVVGGQVDVEDRYVAPTVVRAIEPGSAVMEEEIFGPVLPVLTFGDLDEVISAVNAGEKPLALYLFTRNDEAVAQVESRTSSGALCVNDALTHLLVTGLPFGGVGGSGYGAYHGRWGLETFSHAKAVWQRPRRFKDLPLLNPPYTKAKQAAVRRLF